MTAFETVVRDTGAPMDGDVRVYEVVRDGEQILTIKMRDYDAVNYSKAMGYVYMQPAPVEKDDKDDKEDEKDVEDKEDKE